MDENDKQIKLSAKESIGAKLAAEELKNVKSLREAYAVIERITDSLYDSKKRSLAAEEKLLKVNKDLLDNLLEQQRTQRRNAAEYGRAQRAADKLKSSFSAITKIDTSVLTKSGIFDERKLKLASIRFDRNLTNSFKKFNASGGGLKNTPKLLGAIGKSGLKAGAGLARAAGPIGIFAMVISKFVETAAAVDSAAASLTRATGVLDGGFSRTLLNATEKSALLGGNVALAGEYAAQFINQLSPAVPITSTIVSNLATIGERFGLGADNSAKLLDIVSQLNGTTFEVSSTILEGVVDSLGKLGPAAVRTLVSSYDAVIDSFSIGYESLLQQSLEATRLGVSLSRVATVGRGLLDFQSSITAEFRASAMIGKQLNLQKARQLAYEGDIVGAYDYVLDTVEKIGGLNKLGVFQREAIAKAAGMEASELSRRLNIRKQLGTQERVQEATRRDALGALDRISRKLQNIFFKVLASPQIQKVFEMVTDKLDKLLSSDGGLQKLADDLSTIIDKLIGLLTGEYKLDKLFGIIPYGISSTSNNRNSGNFVTTMNDGIITPQGSIVKTNPRDYIIATTNPQSLTQPSPAGIITPRDFATKANPQSLTQPSPAGIITPRDFATKANPQSLTQLSPTTQRLDMNILQDIKKLLVTLQTNGVHSNVYIDGRKVSSSIASALR